MDILRELEEERERKKKELRARERAQAAAREAQKNALAEKEKEKEKAKAQQLMLEHKAKSAKHPLMRQRYAAMIPAKGGQKKKGSSAGSSSARYRNASDEEPEDDENGNLLSARKVRPSKGKSNQLHKPSQQDKSELMRKQAEERKILKQKHMLRRMRNNTAEVSWDYSDLFGDVGETLEREELEKERARQKAKADRVRRTQQAMELINTVHSSSSAVKSDKKKTLQTSETNQKATNPVNGRIGLKDMDLEMKKRAIREKMAQLFKPKSSKLEGIERNRSSPLPSPSRLKHRDRSRDRDPSNLREDREDEDSPKWRKEKRRVRNEEEVSDDEDSLDDFIEDDSEGDDDEMVQLRNELRRRLAGNRKRARSYSDEDNDDSDSFDGGFEALQREEARSAALAKYEDEQEWKAEQKRKRLKAERMKRLH